MKQKPISKCNLFTIGLILVESCEASWQLILTTVGYAYQNQTLEQYILLSIRMECQEERGGRQIGNEPQEWRNRK